MNNPDRLAENPEEEEEEYIPDEVDKEGSDDDLEYDSEYESESSVDLEEEMGVTVRTVMGQEFNFMVTLDTTVIDLKMAIFVNLNRMHPDTQVGLVKIENLLVLMLVMLMLMLMLVMLMLVMLNLVLMLIRLNLVLMLILVAQVLTYQGEEMEEDDETMADYDIQVEIR